LHRYYEAKDLAKLFLRPNAGVSGVLGDTGVGRVVCSFE
jgi:hypothetical protein